MDEDEDDELEREIVSALKPCVTRIYAAPRYTVMEYCMAKILGTTSGFESMWVVRLFNEHMRGHVRSQQSLLNVSATKPEEYFGADPKSLDVATEVLKYFEF